MILKIINITIKFKQYWFFRVLFQILGKYLENVIIYYIKISDI